MATGAAVAFTLLLSACGSGSSVGDQSDESELTPETTSATAGSVAPDVQDALTSELIAKRVPATKPRYIVAIGSTALLNAGSELTKVFGQQIVIDADRGRTWDDLGGALETQNVAQDPPDVLIIHADSTAAATPEAIGAVLGVAGAVPTLIVLTEGKGNPDEAEVNTRIASLLSRRSGARLLDWANRMDASWIDETGTDLTLAGQEGYADLLRKVLADIAPSVEPTSAAFAPTTALRLTTTLVAPSTSSPSTLPPVPFVPPTTIATTAAVPTVPPTTVAKTVAVPVTTIARTTTPKPTQPETAPPTVASTVPRTALAPTSATATSVRAVPAPPTTPATTVPAPAALPTTETKIIDLETTTLP
jgi:hypothetical protein